MGTFVGQLEGGLFEFKPICDNEKLINTNNEQTVQTPHS